MIDRRFGSDKRDAVLSKLRLRDLELLLAIHEHKSITAAAAEHGLTQPAASRALRDIEQLLRVHLFERDRSKGMSLTPAGDLVLMRARALLADYRSLAAEIEAYRSGTGSHLRLGIIPLVSSQLIEMLMSELTGTRLRMSVTVTEGSTTSLLEDLRMQRLDAVIGRCSSTPLPPGLSQETILEQDGCLLVHMHSPLVRMARVKLSDLDGFGWLLPPAGTPTRTAINAVFAKAKRPPPVPAVEASSIKVIHATLRGNPRMVSIVPSDAGHDIQSLGSVRRLPFPVPLHMPPIDLISATRHRGTPVVRNLQGVLREILRNRREAA